MVACENGHLNIVRLLVSKQANVGVQSKVSHLHSVLHTFMIHCLERAHMSVGCLCEWPPRHSGVLTDSPPDRHEC